MRPLFPSFKHIENTKNWNHFRLKIKLKPCEKLLKIINWGISLQEILLEKKNDRWINKIWVKEQRTDINPRNTSKISSRYITEIIKDISDIGTELTLIAGRAILQGSSVFVRCFDLFFNMLPNQISSKTIYEISGAQTHGRRNIEMPRNQFMIGEEIHLMLSLHTISYPRTLLLQGLKIHRP